MKNQLWMELNLDRLRENLLYLRNCLRKETKIMAVVKSDAYGHGILVMSWCLLRNGVDALAVASVEEGLELRLDGINAPILVLNEILPENASIAIGNGLTPTISNFAILKTINSIARRRRQKVKVHVKIDTGMGDSGLMVKDLPKLVTALKKSDYVEVEGIYSHLTSMYGGTREEAEEQLAIFQQGLRELEARGVSAPLIHLLSSPSVLKFPGAEFGMVRAGIVLYGLKSNNELADAGTRPVMQLKTRIVGIKPVENGFKGGYGWSFTTDRPVLIATVPMGYSDAFFLHFIKDGEVIIRGTRAPMLGRVCMNHFMVDVTHIPGVEVGDEVIIIGEQGNEKILAEEIAGKTGVSLDNCDCLCLLNRKLPRVYLENGREVKGLDYQRLVTDIGKHEGTRDQEAKHA
ncbi:MAG: alanine racemase [Firmicutes bacterium]|nr:alanine racemase [Bacillota bacterium]